MSETYKDLVNTNFPNNLDTYKIYVDVNADNIQYVEQIKTDITNHNFESASAIFKAHPELNNVIATASLFQHYEDAILAMERTYVSDFSKTITSIIHYKGDYDNSTTYHLFDLVDYGERCYLYISPIDISGKIPTNTTYWRLQDIKGQSGTGMAFYTAWDNITTYKKLDCVPYSNSLYVSIVDNNLNHNPSTNTDYWQKVIVEPRATEWDVAQPENQDTGDVWFQTNETNDSLGIYQCTANNQYSQKYPSTNAKYVKYGDGKDLESNSARKSTIVNVVLSADNWQGNNAPYTQSLAIQGVTNISNQEIIPAIDITNEELKAIQEANIQDGGQSTNAIVLKAVNTKPTINVPITVVLRGDM